MGAESVVASRIPEARASTGVVVALLGLMLAACSDEESYSVRVTFEDAAQLERAAWVEVYLLRSCPAVADVGEAPAAELIDGLPHVSFRVGQPSGTLGGVNAGSQGRYGLYARAMDDSCDVFAAGCASIDFSATTGDTLEVEVAAVDGPGCGPGESCESGLCQPATNQCSETNRLDLLVVWDTSPEMQTIQNRFLASLPSLVNELPPTTEVHVAAVTADLGTGEYEIAQCTDTGDDADFQICDVDSTQFGIGDPGVITDFLLCALPRNTGCGYEMSLEPMYRALTDSRWSLPDDSVLVVLFVSNEDDCSTHRFQLFDVADVDLGPIQSRCLHTEMLNDVGDYIRGLRDLRDQCPTRLIVGGVLGLPTFWDGDYRSPDLEPELDGDGNVMRVCQASPEVWAAPAPRLAEVAVELGGTELVVSACASEFGPVLGAIGARAAAELRR